MLAAAHPNYSTWKVQSAGKAAEFWLTQVGARPVYVGRVSETMELVMAPGTADMFTDAEVQEAWSSIVNA